MLGDVGEGSWEAHSLLMCVCPWPSEPMSHDFVCDCVTLGPCVPLSVPGINAALTAPILDQLQAQGCQEWVPGCGRGCAHRGERPPPTTCSRSPPTLPRLGIAPLFHTSPLIYCSYTLAFWPQGLCTYPPPIPATFPLKNLAPAWLSPCFHSPVIPGLHSKQLKASLWEEVGVVLCELLSVPVPWLMVCRHARPPTHRYPDPASA